VLSAPAIALAAAALVAGATGSWSPCGLSMIETLGPTGHTGGRRTTLAACATFALGALAGGVATFATLAALGGLARGGVGDGIAVALAVAVALLAALGEARGARIVPQIRRQVPEPWRRTLPLPLAGALYGVLLGLGFTTFVLTFAVWALAAIAFALGDPALGVLVGLAFGVGRALPIVVLAPLAETGAGIDARAAMAERPALLRGFRLADAFALVACALALLAAPVEAAPPRPTVTATAASDPSASGALLAWQVPGSSGFLRTAEGPLALPGRDPALGEPYLAVHDGDTVRVLRADSRAEVAALTVAGVDALAVSERWLVWRATGPRGNQTIGNQTIGARSLVDPAAPPRTLARAPRGRLGRPALGGDRLAFHVAGLRTSRIVVWNLATGARTRARGQRGVLVTNPALLGDRLLYVRASWRSQALMLGAVKGSGRRDVALYRIAPGTRRDRGYEPGRHPLRRHGRDPNPPPRAPRGVKLTLWTTALAPDAAYVTLLRATRGATTASLLRIAR